jgi:alkylhydroperoxidase family enzyme
MASIPRLGLEAIDPALSARLKPRVERLGYLGEFFQCAAHAPAALDAFIGFTEAAKHGLPENVVELIALTAATRLGNQYERNQHERLSIRLGLGRDWVAGVERCRPDELTRAEATVQRYVLRALESCGRGAKAELDAMVGELGPEQAVAVMMVLGRYLVHALFVNSLELEPPVPSIFEDGFE